MDKVIEILSELHPEVDFTTETGLIDKGILDSFDIVTITSEVMDVFSVVFSAEEIIPEHFNSAKALYDLIQRKAGEE